MSTPAELRHIVGIDPRIQLALSILRQRPASDATIRLAVRALEGETIDELLQNGG